MAASAVETVRTSLERHGTGRECVVQVLSDVNRELGHVPEEAMRELAAAVGVSNTEIYSVASFYSFLDTRPRGRHIVRVCTTVSCRMQGGRDILEGIGAELGIEPGETTPDGRVTLETTSCIGLCDQAPAMLVDDDPHTGLTPEEARRIVAGLD